MIRSLADLAMRYIVHTFRRFPRTKHYALEACFLVEIHEAILDHIVTLRFSAQEHRHEMTQRFLIWRDITTTTVAA